MKIAYINQPTDRAIPPVRRASIAIITYQLARRMSKFQDILVYGARGPREKKSLSYEGVNYRYVPLSFEVRLLRFMERLSTFLNICQPFFASSLYYFGYILQVACHLRTQQCDIVHLHNFSQFVPIIRKLNPKIKIVLHMNCEWLTQLNKNVIGKRIENADLIIGCSEYITNKIRQQFPHLAGICQTIYNGVDVDHFNADDKAFNVRKNGVKRLLFIGRVSPEKGVHVLLEALPEIIERFPEIQLDIVGPPAVPPIEFINPAKENGTLGRLTFYYKESYLAYLQKLAEFLNILPYVRFNGHVAQTNLVDYYQDADLFITPSVWQEPFGMINVEAMACGVPVVATHVGGIPEIIETGKTGLLVEPDNARELAKGIICLLENDELRKSIRKSACQRVVECFSWNVVSNNMLDLYNAYFLSSENVMVDELMPT